MGFENIVYGVSRAQASVGPDNLRMTQPLAAWQQTYLEHDDGENDPLFNDASRLPTRFHTGPEFIHDDMVLDDAQRAVIQRGSDFGLISGMAFVMIQKDQPLIGSWNILTEDREDRATAEFLQHGNLMQLALTVAHGRMMQLAGQCEKTSARLTPREAECLLWLTKGYRTAQIAEKMGIRPVTVDLHIRNARGRLGARTRAQALAIAISDGLITP
jgi:DNA-binding CsgD family transcriptional regulator